MKRPTEKLIAVTLLAALALSGYAAYRLWDFTCDDAFITLRYSRNLVRGLGPTFNAAPPRAEGYTSVLWMLLTALGHLGGGDAVAVAKAMGVALTLLTVGVCFALAWTLCEGGEPASRAFAAALAAALFAAYPLTPVHAVSGMDTALAALALSLLVLAASRAERASSPALPFCALLAGLTRPELNLAAATLLALKFPRADRAERLRFLRNALLFYVLPGAAYFAWRATYYGSLLPLPFYVKAASPEPRGVYPAIHFGIEVAACFGPLLALSLVNLNAKAVTALAVVAVMMAYLVFPEPVMGYGHRYFHPLVPVVAAVSARGALLIFSVVRERLGGRRAAIAYAVILLLALAAMLPRYETVGLDFRQYATGLRNAHIRLGRLLRECGAGADAVLAIADAGAVPYYSGWETVDTFGLNDRHIARTGDHSAGYVFSRRPSLVVLVSLRAGAFHPRLRWEQALYWECLRRGMVKLCVLDFAPGYYLWLIAPPDTPLADRLKAELVRGSTPE